MYVYASSVNYKTEELLMAKRTPDLEIGSFYGDWEILEEKPRSKEKYYLCKCKCGITKEVSKSNLRLGKSTSCNKGTCKSLALTHGMANTRLYGIWSKMKGRLVNPNGNNKCYHGITLYPVWESFEPFRDWALANGYSDNLTIDRIDGTKGYEPTNCRWVTNLVQSQNRRKHKSKEFDLPKGIFKTKPRNGETKYQGTGKAPYYWIVTYKGKRHQRWGFSTPEEAYQDKLQFIKDNYDGLVYPD